MFLKSIKTPVVFLVSLLILGVLSCANLTSSDDNGSDGEIVDPPALNLQERIPDSLQYNAPEAWALVSVMVAQVEAGAQVASAVAQVVAAGGGEQSFTQQGVTVTYRAEAETRDGTEGTTWAVIYDGKQTGASGQTFDNVQAYSGWTANDGSQGEYVWNFDAYSTVQGSGAQGEDAYEVSWSMDSADALTVDIIGRYADDTEQEEYTLVSNADGSGQLYEADEMLYEWDSNGNLIE